MSTEHQPAPHADRDGSEVRYPDAVRSLVNAAKAEAKAQRTIADLQAEVADLRAAAVEMAPKDEVLVEGSYFARADLPRILGNYMRSAGEAWQDVKALAEQVADTRRRAEKAEAALARVGALADQIEARAAMNRQAAENHQHDPKRTSFVMVSRAHASELDQQAAALRAALRGPDAEAIRDAT